LRAAKAEKSLRIFSEQAWPIVVPAPYVPGWYVDALCQHFEAVVRGEIKRLLVTIPPRSTKSTVAAVMLPAWVWTTNPCVRMLYASYAESLAVRDATTSRRLLQSTWYQQNWGDRFELAGDMNLKHRYENNHGGLRLSVGIGGSITGEGGDILTIDDAHNIKEIESAVARKGVIDWFGQVWSTRANDPRAAGWIVIGQRSHCDDLPGHLLEMGNWEHLNLPTEFEGDKRVTSIGWSDPRQKEGALLCPARFGPDEAEEAKRTLGSFAYSAQHQQRPVPAGGGVWKKDWFRFYRRADLPVKFDMVAASWDCAFKDLKTSDYVAGQLWGRTGADFYLLDQVHAKLDFPATLAAIRNLNERAKYAVNAVLVEDKANGSAVISVLKREITGMLAINPEGGKEARASAVSPMIEAGNVLLPIADEQPWVEDTLLEFVTFPAAKHDDRVDATSQALLWLQRKKRKFSGMFAGVNTSLSVPSYWSGGNYGDESCNPSCGDGRSDRGEDTIVGLDGRRINRADWLEGRIQ
jgi:predicted phage terminase large subunit-like protein